MMEGGARA